MFPLSSARKGVASPAQESCPKPLGDTCWRSEAFAEDLLSHQVLSSSALDRRTDWPSKLQSVLPLSVALAGGVVAFLDTLI